MTVGAPDGRQSRKRSPRNRSHIPNVSENPMGRQLPSRSHENIWDEVLTPGPEPRLISSNASCFLIYLFILLCTASQICFPSATPQAKKGGECTSSYALGGFLLDILLFGVTWLQATDTLLN